MGSLQRSQSQPLFVKPPNLILHQKAVTAYKKPLLFTSIGKKDFFNHF